MFCRLYSARECLCLVQCEVLAMQARGARNNFLLIGLSKSNCHYTEYIQQIDTTTPLEKENRNLPEDKARIKFMALCQIKTKKKDKEKVREDSDRREGQSSRAPHAPGHKGWTRSEQIILGSRLRHPKCKENS